MLSPEFLEDVPKYLVELFRSFEDVILSDIARRIAKAGQITDTAKWQIERLKMLGKSEETIKQQIMELNSLTDKQIDKLFKEAALISFLEESQIYLKAGKNPLNMEDYREITDLIAALKHQTKGTFDNITQSMGFAANVNGKTVFHPMARTYQSVLDLAQMTVSTGALDYRTAIRMSVKRLADSGIRFVDYQSGWMNHLDVAVRRAIMTGMHQLSTKMTDILAQEMGCEFFEVTAHAGARPSHREWQGQVYHRGGEKDGYPDLESTTGLGMVDGLCGANCRHSYYPFFPGVSVRAYNNAALRDIDPPAFTYRDKVYTAYEATQKQREMETAIRKTKRQLICYEAAGLEEDYLAAAIKLKQQRKHYAEFSHAAGLAQQKDRTQVYGFGHSQASRATWANKKVT